MKREAKAKNETYRLTALVGARGGRSFQNHAPSFADALSMGAALSIDAMSMVARGALKPVDPKPAVDEKEYRENDKAEIVYQEMKKKVVAKKAASRKLEAAEEAEAEIIDESSAIKPKRTRKKKVDAEAVTG